MPSWSSSVRTSANNRATSVMGFCRPVKTFASLIGVASGRVMETSFTDLIRSIVAAPAVRAWAATPLAAGTGTVSAGLVDMCSSFAEMAGGVGQLREGGAGVDQGLQVVAVVPLVDVHGGDHAAVAQPEGGELARAEIAAHDQLVARWVGETAVFTAQVVLVGEEERAQLVRVVGAEEVSGDMAPLILGRRHLAADPAGPDDHDVRSLDQPLAQCECVVPGPECDNAVEINARRAEST